MKNTTIDAPPGQTFPEIELIKRLVASEFGSTVALMNSRTKIVPQPMIRHVAMVLARTLLPTDTFSLPVIARAFNRVSHVSVIHAIKEIKQRAEVSPTFNARYCKLLATVKSAFEEINK